MVIMWGEEIPGLMEALDPAVLSGKSPEWAKDLAAWGKWRPGRQDLSSADSGPLVWQAEKDARDSTVVLCGRCASSMDAARHFRQYGRITDWDSLLAVEQTAGRGQRGRNWVSPPGNIYGAWMWPGVHAEHGVDPKWRGFLSLLAGYVVAVALEQHRIPIRIKWPNDLLISNRKCGGILIEDRPEYVMVGIGINAAHFPTDHLLRNDFAVGATSLAHEGFATGPLSLWTQIVTSGKERLEGIFHSMEPEQFMKLLAPKMAWMGRRVLVRSAQNSISQGIITGLAPDGGLILRSGDTETILHTGSIILDDEG